MPASDGRRFAERGRRKIRDLHIDPAADPASSLAAMFSGQMEPSKKVKGRYFIDRNGQLFGYVLDYLRQLDRWQAPSDPDLRQRLSAEAEYYCLAGMLEKTQSTKAESEEKTAPMVFGITTFPPWKNWHFSPRVPLSLKCQLDGIPTHEPSEMVAAVMAAGFRLLVYTEIRDQIRVLFTDR